MSREEDEGREWRLPDELLETMFLCMQIPEQWSLDLSGQLIVVRIVQQGGTKFPCLEGGSSPFG